MPLPILKGGMRLGALLPGGLGDKIGARLRERGFDCDFANLDSATIDAVFSELTEMGIDVESGKAQVHLSCE